MQREVQPLPLPPRQKDRPSSGDLAGIIEHHAVASRLRAVSPAEGQFGDRPCLERAADSLPL
jgi:hypothetical protein